MLQVVLVREVACSLFGERGIASSDAETSVVKVPTSVTRSASSSEPRTTRPAYAERYEGHRPIDKHHRQDLAKPAALSPPARPVPRM